MVSALPGTAASPSTNRPGSGQMDLGDPLGSYAKL
jgi:hypothetical protein